MFVRRPACPLCQGEPSAELYRRPFGDPAVAASLAALFPRPTFVREALERDYVVLCCDACGFAWQKHILDGPSVERLYEEGIDHDAALAKTDLASMEVRLRVLASVLLVPALLPAGRARDARVLDFGMGYGHWLRLALSLGLDAEGVEISRRKVEYAKSFGCKVFEGLDQARGPYHAVHANQVLEHVDDPRAVLRQLAARLAPGGILLLSVPDAGPEIEAMRQGRWTPGKGAVHPMDHINGFTFEGFLRLLASEGFSLASPVGVRELLSGSTRLTLAQDSLDHLPWVLTRDAGGRP